MKRFTTIYFFAAIVFICGCKDAPRDNVLDPVSTQYVKTAAVKGSVLLLNQKNAVAVAFASISSLEDSVTVSSDVNGYFSFETLSIGSQTLVCTKENFVSDTQRIVLKSRTSTEVAFYLNGAPYVLSQNILTRKIDQYYPSPQYFVDITASVTDPNGFNDVDSVWFTVSDPTNNFIVLDTLMAYSTDTKLFQITIYKYDLPTNTIQWLVNKPLKIRSKDQENAVNLSTPFYVSRIIENTATPVYPITNPLTQNRDTTGTTPVFQWSPPDVTFNYTYTLLLSRVEPDIPRVVWTYTNLNSSNSQLQYPGNNSSDTLSAGEYLWTISVVDDFGNYSRSKGASFIVR